MTDGLSINIDKHLVAFERMAATSKKTLPKLWKQEAKICFGGTPKMPGVASITPPYSAGGGQNTATAEKQAKAKIAGDIHSLYGQPGDAYDAIHATAPAAAGAFWYLYQHGEQRAASDILREKTGSILYPFDGGKFHRTMRKSRAGGGGNGGRRFKFYLTDPEKLAAYIKEVQSHVWWLASGWAEPLRALGARLPAGVKKLPAPGHLRVITTDSLLEIAMVNDVKFAGQIADMQRRIQTVFNTYRVARLDKMWVNYMAKLAGESGLKKTG